MPQPTNPSLTDLTVDRRTFVRAAGAAGVGFALAGCAGGGNDQPAEGRSAAAPKPKPSMRRYAIVGLGVRSRMYHDAIEKDYKQHAQLVGLCDTNPGRLELAQARSTSNGAATPPPAYGPADFEKMIRQQNVDTVIVTTVDAFHN